ncbi:hypothetical protein NQ317_015565, partial [Molorchus minor]
FKRRVWRFSSYFRVRRIDYDYSQSDPSTSDLARTLPNAMTIVFDVFTYIFRSKESIATIPEMIRALTTFPDFARTLPKARNTVFGIFPYIFRVQGIDYDYPETIRVPPELSRSLKPPC